MCYSKSSEIDAREVLRDDSFLVRMTVRDL
jgi:hypothetical protein